MYLWRKLTEVQRAELVEWRKRRDFPWHSPPHAVRGRGTYHLSAACFNHAQIIGHSPARMECYCEALHIALAPVVIGIHAWCVLPNHYHLLISVLDLRSAIRALGKLHGRTSFAWNREEGLGGRQVWHSATDRLMRSDRHYYATVNYIHHNPVHHGYVKRWQDWPYGSVQDYLNKIGREEAERIWRNYPLEDYGKSWDEPWM